MLVCVCVCVCVGVCCCVGVCVLVCVFVFVCDGAGPKSRPFGPTLRSRPFGPTLRDPTQRGASSGFGLYPPFLAVFPISFVLSGCLLGFARQPESQDVHILGSQPSNTTKIPRKDTQRETQKEQKWREREKERNFGPHPSGPHPSGPRSGCSSMLFSHLVVLSFFFEKEGQKTETPIWAKIGLAKVGQIFWAKVGLAKVP